MGVRWKLDSPFGGNAVGIGHADGVGAARLGVSAASSAGVGVFIIVGYVAKHVAGPATLVSIAIAAVIAVSSGQMRCDAIRCVAGLSITLLSGRMVC